LGEYHHVGGKFPSTPLTFWNIQYHTIYSNLTHALEICALGYRPDAVATKAQFFRGPVDCAEDGLYIV
jgi:hypothetical protein